MNVIPHKRHLSVAIVLLAAVIAAFSTGSYATEPNPIIIDGQTAPKVIRVVVWDERQPKQKEAYKNFLGNRIAEHLGGLPGLTVRSVCLDDPEQGLSDEVLDNCDVLVWWGHVRQPEIKPEKARAIVRRILDGRLSLLTLHSAHWSTPFKEAMYERTRRDAIRGLPKEAQLGKMSETYPQAFRAPQADAPMTPSVEYRRRADGKTDIAVQHGNCCFPVYRVADEPSHIRVTLPKHPIAQGVPATFTIPKTEVYAEPFHVPKPDYVLFKERWEPGEWFRAGMLWKLGHGQVFYFRPGHETYPIFADPTVLKIIENAVRFLGAGSSQGES